MKIPLNEIKPSPNPIRKTWDEQKMKELTESLHTEGQVEPIGVRTNGKPDEYIIVWGHRRVEAARRNNWDEIDAVFVKSDEVDNLIQAGIENLANEDMSADDKAEWVWRLTELGLSQKEISRRSTVSEFALGMWKTYKREKDAGVIAITPNRVGDEGVKRVLHIANTLGNDIEAKKAVMNKSSEEELTEIQTRELARAYRDAPNAQVKEAVLKAPIISRDTSADILRRSTARVQLEQGVESIKETNDWQKEREERREFQDFDFAVKSHLDSMRLFLESVRKGNSLVKFGKYSPEAAKFVIRKHNQLIDEIKSYNDILETV